MSSNVWRLCSCTFLTFCFLQIPLLAALQSYDHPVPAPARADKTREHLNSSSTTHTIHYPHSKRPTVRYVTSETQASVGKTLEIPPSRIGLAFRTQSCVLWVSALAFQRPRSKNTLQKIWLITGLEKFMFHQKRIFGGFIKNSFEAS